MPVPSLITDLTTVAATNSPTGSESPATADDYFRAHASFIAQLRDSPGQLLNVRIISAVGASTYTPTAGTNSVIVELQAAGGAGGGAPATGAGQCSLGASGTSGAYAKARFTTGFAGVTVTLGAVGAAATGAAGGAAAASSFGALMSCPGGHGGGVLAATASTPIFGSSSHTAQPSGGNIYQVAGAPSATAGMINVISGFVGLPSASVLGAPSALATQLSYGVGGIGTNRTPSLGANTGGTGGPAVCIIYEYT